MISFQNLDVAFSLKRKSLIKKWIKLAVDDYKMSVCDLAFIFTNDENIIKINQKYLQHDYYTDVITFDYSTDKCIGGDIFISIDTVSYNAKKYNFTFEEELHRVMIHGVLHLLGFQDKDEPSQKNMRNLEDKYLKILENFIDEHR